MKNNYNYFHLYKPAIYNCRMLLLVFSYTFFGSIYNGYSQKNTKLNYSEVKNIIKSFYVYNREKSYSSYLKIEKRFDSLELAVIASKDKSALLTFYKEKADFFYYENDHKSAIRYINKGFKILENYKDNRSLGLLYESLGLLHIEGISDEDNFKFMLKSANLLNKYGDITDKIDCNINIGMYYKANKQWRKAIDYFLLAQKNTQLTTNDPSKFVYTNLFLAKCYFELNIMDTGQKHLDFVETNKKLLAKDYSFESQYHNVKGLRATKIANYKTACEEFKTEKIYTSKLFKERNGYLNSYVSVRTNLALTEIENKKAKTENIINKKNLRYRNIILLLGVIIIMFLLLYYIIQFKDEKYKTKTNNELKNSNQKLLEINNEITANQSTKKKFLDAITFELRAPLNSIKGYTYKIRDNVDNDKVEDYRKAMAFSTEYLLHLINDMIDSNVVSDIKPMFLKNKPANLNQLFLNIVNTYELNDDNKGKISYEIDDKISKEINIDVFRFTQLLINLNFIENSLKFNDESEIKLKAQLISKDEKSQLIKFIINDSGIIFPDENLKQIENYFNDFDNTANDEFEAAYGFSVVKKLFELFETTPKIESKEKEGVSVFFSINFEIIEVIIPNKIEEKTTYNKDLKGIKILLVEDNKINQLLTKKILINNGFECDVASDGLEAVTIVRDKDYDLILMDIMMPVMDGFEASIEIKKMKPNIPIVALTAVSEEVNKDRFEECHIEQVLTKPVDVAILCSTIKSHFN